MDLAISATEQLEPILDILLAKQVKVNALKPKQNKKE